MPKDKTWRDDLGELVGLNIAAWFWFFSMITVCMVFLDRTSPPNPDYETAWWFVSGVGLVSLAFAFMPIIISASDESTTQGLSVGGRILYLGSNLMVITAVVLGKSHPLFMFWLGMALWSFVGGLFFRVWWRKLTAEGEDNG